MNRIEWNPRRFHECAEPGCRDLITDGWVFRLNPHEVICLRDYVECCVSLWSAGFYDQRATP